MASMAMPPPPPPVPRAQTTFSAGPAPRAQTLLKLFDEQVGNTPKYFVPSLMTSRICQSKRPLFDRPILKCQQNSSYLNMLSQLISTPSDYTDRSGRKRRMTDTTMLRDFGSECGGIVYGTTAGQLLAFCGCSKGKVPLALRIIHGALKPVADSVLTTLGQDSTNLCDGLFAHRMARVQQQALTTGSGGVTREFVSVNIHSRHGSSSMLVGATASVVCVFSLLTNRSFNPCAVEDVAWIVSNEVLVNTLLSACEALRGSVPTHGFACSPKWELQAIGAEFRALERAKAGVRIAIQLCSLHKLPPAQALDLQMLYLKRAAFPAESNLCDATQPQMLRDVSLPMFFASQQDMQPQPRAFQGGFVVPLSQLSSVVSQGGSGGSGGSRGGSDASSVTGSSVMSHPLSNCSSVVSEYQESHDSDTEWLTVSDLKM